MRISKVTITGADDSVDPRWMVEVAHEFPFVEWGVLFSQKRQGLEPRYPSNRWQRRLARAVQWGTLYVPLAAHLCGENARIVIDGMDGFFSRPDARLYERVQLNGVSESFRSKPPYLTMVRKHPEVEFIFQCANERMAGLMVPVLQHHENASVLFDASGGRGEPADELYAPLEVVRCGYAGGLGPENVEEVLGKLARMERYSDVSAAVDRAAGRNASPESSCWIDMESRVRTDDGSRLDLDRVLAVLEKARPFIEAGKEDA